MTVAIVVYKGLIPVVGRILTDLMRERVRQEMQVGHALIGVDIGDVGHPQLVDPVDGQSLDHVLVLPVRMVGACRVTALPGLQHQV